MKYLLRIAQISLVLALIVCSFESASAQVSYTYDAAGNRTAKTVVLAKTMKKMAQSDTVFAAESAAVAIDLGEPQTDALGQAEIKIYPNPTKGALRVDIGGVELSSDDRIAVFDSDGRLVKDCNNLTDSNQIDLSEAANGIYFMRITIGKEKTTWRIIKE